jgi:selenocysteine lyase/cysteine desulfurase
MAIAALEQICEWKVPLVAATLAARTSDIARRAAGLELDPMPDSQRGPHMLGVPLPEPARSRAISALADVNCFAAVRGASLRISPHLHTTNEDVERLVVGLALAMQYDET